jgi:hypothetical protein
MKEAPMIMMSAGFGDIIGKYVSICDWKMSNVINGEYYCDLVAEQVIMSVEKCIENLDGLYRREDEAVKSVMESLVLSGITISFVGNSRPASSSEHHFAHFWELMLMFDHKKAALHGTKVESEHWRPAKCSKACEYHPGFLKKAKRLRFLMDKANGAKRSRRSTSRALPMCSSWGRIQKERSR